MVLDKSKWDYAIIKTTNLAPNSRHERHSSSREATFLARKSLFFRDLSSPRVLILNVRRASERASKHIYIHVGEDGNAGEEESHITAHRGLFRSLRNISWISLRVYHEQYEIKPVELLAINSYRASRYFIRVESINNGRVYGCMRVRDRRWPKERTEGTCISMVIAITRTRARVSLAAINNAIKHEFVRLSRERRQGGRISLGEYSARALASYFRLWSPVLCKGNFSVLLVNQPGPLYSKILRKLYYARERAVNYLPR